MSDMKLAADAIRETAMWKSRATTAETKVAAFERKERIEGITKAADEKGATLPENMDLEKCSEDELTNIERALELITPHGEIKLASLEGDESGGTVPLAEQLSELDEYLLDPNFQGP